MLCFRKFLVAKKFMNKRWGVSRFSVENLLSHGAEKLGRGNPLVFHSFRVSKKFIDKRGGREYQDFPSKTYCLTVPKYLVGEPVCAVFQKISGSEKVYG